MGPVAKRLRGNWPSAAFALYWIVHIYIWGIWGWKESELFNDAWWFDTAGHALAGVVGALNLLYFYKTYSLHGIFRFAGKRHLTKDIVSDVAISGIVWELIELLWDYNLQPNYFEWLAKAQKGVADTMFDLVTNPFAALLTLLFYFGSSVFYYNYIYPRIYPEDAKKAMMEEEIDEVLEMLKHMDQKVRTIQKEHLKRLLPTLKEFLRAIVEKEEK